MSDSVVLVTGAGGFIGGRVVEVLQALGRHGVRAGVRRWSSGARIGRFPVEIVACDVTDRDAVERSRAEAERRGILEFFDSHKSKTGTVAIFDSGSGAPRAVFKGELDVEKYRAALPGAGA